MKSVFMRYYLKITAWFIAVFTSIVVVFAPIIPELTNLMGYKSFLGIEFTGETEKSYLNVLLMGLDADETRSDVIMIAQLNLVNNSVNILQIPRDTYIKNKRSDKKINSAYGAGGPKNTIKEIQTLVDIDIDNYVVVTTSGFRDVIDAVGGVYYDVPMDMDYEDPIQDLYIHLKKGYQLLDGDKAEQYVRFRYGYANGDIGRVQAQQDFIKSAMKQIIERNIGNKDADNQKLITSLSKMVDTDFTISEMFKYAPYILSINMDNVNVMMIKCEPKYMNNISYVMADDEGNAQLIRDYFTPDISEADLSEVKTRDEAIGSSVEHSISEAPTVNTPESDISVYILDYSGTDGQKLSEVKTKLESAGYTVGGSVYAKTTVSDKTYCISSDATQFSVRVAETLGRQNYYLNTIYSNDADVVVIIGKDYK